MFLELCLEALGSSPVATVTSGNSGLLSICEGPSGLFSSHGSGIGPHLDLRKLTQGSSLVETVFSGFLLSFTTDKANTQMRYARDADDKAAMYLRWAADALNHR